MKRLIIALLLILGSDRIANAVHRQEDERISILREAR